MYTNHTYCRACGYGKPGAQGIKSSPTDKLIAVFDLGVQPLANDFAKDGEPRAGYAPLKVLFCPRCSLAQLSATVDPSILYSRYSYVTSPSQMMQDHFRTLINDIMAETDKDNVLEIGSNDGKLLSMMQDSGFSCLGIDPAANLAEIARGNGIETITGLFSVKLVDSVCPKDIIIARHVFCHVDNWNEFVAALESVSYRDTLVCIEVPYVGDLLRNCEFDTIYHEHLSYLSINAMQALLGNTQFHLHRIIRYPIHGGAMLLMLRRNGCLIAPHPSVAEFKERITVDDWVKFEIEAKDQINRLSSTVRSLVAQGKRVAGLGASAKSTVWISSCGFSRNEIGFIADNTPQKQYTVSPGTDIPIVDEGAILRELPDYVVMWAWNYRKEILDKFQLARSKGVKFIVPVPRVEII